MSTEYKATRTMTKGKYAELERVLKESIPDQGHVETMLKCLRETLKFDPDVSTYDETKSKNIRAYRERMKAQGVSSYVYSGAKASYDKKKIVHNTTI